jgi:nitroreductase
MADSEVSSIRLDFEEYPVEKMELRAKVFRQEMAKRRSIREFSSRPIPKNVITECLRTAGTAPSGANRQPWHFAVVQSPEIKKSIREAAEEEEKEFYQRRAPQDWLDALAPIGTDADKPFLEIAPCLIVAFAEKYVIDDSGQKQKNYYVTESASLACAFLIAALHNAGLATLTHTPSPMKFLNRILKRPEAEKPLMLIVTGYPAADARVPDISRKPLDDFTSYF